MTIKILADLHHGDLYESLRILFEDRLDWELYRPVGLEWFEQNYWAVLNLQVTAQQYLGLHLVDNPNDLHGNVFLNKHNGPPVAGVYAITDGHRPHRKHRGILLDAAKELKFDIVLSSISEHFEPYAQFKRLYCPNAKHIHQSGNHQPCPFGTLNSLNSTRYPNPQVPNQVHYHQEFSLTEFQPTPVANPRTLSNFMHLHHQHYLDEFQELRRLLADWTVKDWGAGNADGPCRFIHQEFATTGFVWHAKKKGDGYGYNIHNAFACGRPLVTHGRDYVGRTAAALFEDGQTIIDLDHRTPQEVARLLRAAADDWPAWHARVLQRFHEVVNFDAEFIEIKKFLDRLL